MSGQAIAIRPVLVPWQRSTNRIFALPAPRRLSNARKDPLPFPTHIQELNDCTRMAFRQQIDKRSASSHSPRMANGITSVEEALQIGSEIFRAIADMLQALVPSLEEVTVERRGIVALLDQFHLQWARIGKRQRDIDRRRLAFVREIGDR